MASLKQMFQIIPNVNIVRVFIGLGHWNAGVSRI
jgi:hypothetical protein